MIGLEFFCGTKSFTREARALGHKCFCIDMNYKMTPDLTIDIMDFEIDALPEEFRCPDWIWFSPPCTKYSHAYRIGKPDLTTSNNIIKKCLDLIEQFKKINPNIIWILENPQTGTLKNQEFMYGVPYTDASYCKYGLPYRKQTRFWNNMKLILKTCKKDCGFIDGGKHIMSVGNGNSKYTGSSKYINDIELKYVVPELLCIDILNHMEKVING